MKSVKIPCKSPIRSRTDRLEVRDAPDLLELWAHEDDECCLVCLDREGVEKLIAAAQEWLEETK